MATELERAEFVRVKTFPLPGVAETYTCPPDWPAEPESQVLCVMVALVPNRLRYREPPLLTAELDCDVSDVN